MFYKLDKLFIDVIIDEKVEEEERTSLRSIWDLPEQFKGPIIRDGYKYHVNAWYKDIITYRCEMYQTSRCKGMIKKNMKTGIETFKENHTIMEQLHP